MSNNTRGVNKLTHHLKMFYRFALVLLASLLLILTVIACSGTPEPRKSNLVVTYEGKIVHEAKPDIKEPLKPVRPRLIFNTGDDLKLALQSKTRPLVIIYSANWCAPCHELDKILRKEGLRTKVLVLNVDVDWVMQLSTRFGLRGVPTMHIIGMNEKLYTFEGASTIINTVRAIIH